jgi:hypothetical protein
VARRRYGSVAARRGGCVLLVRRTGAVPSRSVVSVKEVPPGGLPSAGAAGQVCSRPSRAAGDSRNGERGEVRMDRRLDAVSSTGSRLTGGRTESRADYGGQRAGAGGATGVALPTASTGPVSGRLCTDTLPMRAPQNNTPRCRRAQPRRQPARRWAPRGSTSSGSTRQPGRGEVSAGLPDRVLSASTVGPAPAHDGRDTRVAQLGDQAAWPAWPAPGSPGAAGPRWPGAGATDPRRGRAGAGWPARR